MGLAFKKFKSVPLYLEWAPLALFSDSKAVGGGGAAAAAAPKSIADRKAELEALRGEDQAATSIDASATLFVKNCESTTHHTHTTEHAVCRAL